MPDTCLSCGASGDTATRQPYPYDDASYPRGSIIPQLIQIDCTGDGPTKQAVLCHDCWHRLEIELDIDMWISQKRWESLNPITPYSDLPPK